MNRDYFWHTEEQFGRLEALLPTDTRGKPRVDDRRVISGIVHVLKSGGRWVNAPETYGQRKTLYNRFVRWAAKAFGSTLPYPGLGCRTARTGTDRLLGREGASPRFRRQRGEQNQAIGRARGGRTTKIHALTDGLCRPIAFLLTGGQVADCTAGDLLLEHAQEPILHADKGYDSNAPELQERSD